MPNTLVVLENTEIPFVVGSELGNDAVFAFVSCFYVKGNRKVSIPVGFFKCQF